MTRAPLGSAGEADRTTTSPANTTPPANALRTGDASPWGEAAPPGDASADMETLVRAYRAGDTAALLALYTLLSHNLQWLMYRARRHLPLAPSLEQADLRQEVWLALAEIAQTWSAEHDGPFRGAAERAVRRALRRSVRHNRVELNRVRIGVAASASDDATFAERAVYEPADMSVQADSTRWGDVLLGDTIAHGLPLREREALVRYVVEERPLVRLADEMGVSRRGARQLLNRAALFGRALLGAAPPPSTPEALVLAAVQASVAAAGDRVPPNAWLVERTGLGRRRVRATLRRLGQLGYLQRRGARWHLARGRELGDA